MLNKQIKSNQAAKRAVVGVRCHGKDHGKRLQKWVRWGLVALGTAAATHSALASPIGYIDGVKKRNEYWAISGWACEPGAGAALQLKLFLNDVPVGVPQYSNEPAEEAVHQLCGTTAGSGIPYRFTVSYNGPISGQNIRIDAINKNAQSTALAGSNEFGLPVIDPEAVIASARKVLVLIVHEDDEIWYTPVIGKYCGSAGKTCRVVATSNAVPDASEFVNAMAFLPAVYDRGNFYTGPGTESPQYILNRWSAQAAEAGLGSLNNVVKTEIDKFAPDVILTFDPRHGTSCHPEHRALGQAVIDGVNAYSGANFNKSNLFLLESRRMDLPQYSASVPAVAKDRFSVNYEMANYNSARSMSGLDFFINMMEKFPSQFDARMIQQVLKADKSDMSISLMPIGNYIANDSRYTGASSDPRVSTCPAFGDATTPTTPTVVVGQAGSALAAPACSSVTLSPNGLPASGGTVSAQAHCSGSNLSYAWSVNGIAYPGNLATNSAPVGVNTSTAPIFYAVCVNATNSLGQSSQCAQLVQAATIPIAPTCSAPSLTPTSLPETGGTVTAQASCSHSGQGMYYTWTVNDAPFSVTSQTVQSAPVGVNGSATPQTYKVCVVANDSNGQSEKACNSVIQAGAASVPPAPPIIGRATRLSNGTSISVAFTPGAMGTGTLVNYTANCGTGPVNGYGSPIIVTGLLANQPYMCKVRAVTTAGTGAWSDYADPVY